MTTPEADRVRALLRKAADALVDGRDPFDHAFLVENEVTLDEVFAMSNGVAHAIRAWVYLIENTEEIRRSLPTEAVSKIVLASIGEELPPVAVGG